MSVPASGVLGDDDSQPPTTRQIARANQLTFALTPSREHYGNLATYMRLKGVVPPTSEH